MNANIHVNAPGMNFIAITSLIVINLLFAGIALLF